MKGLFFISFSFQIIGVLQLPVVDEAREFFRILRQKILTIPSAECQIK